MFTKESIIEFLRFSVEDSLPHLLGRDLYIKAEFANKYVKMGCYLDKECIHGVPEFERDSLTVINLGKYRDSLPQDESSWNKIEIHFDKDLNVEAKFIWDQKYYEEDVESNNKLKRKRKK